MFVFALLAVPISVGALNVRAEYSAWSGLVSWIPIGFERQEIKLALDFGGESSYLWHPHHCPAFLDGGCLRIDDFHREFIRNLIWIGDTFTTESFLIRNHSPGKARLDHAGLDVAGAIAAGPRSVLFAGRVLTLRNTNGVNAGVTIEELERRDMNKISFAAKVEQFQDKVFGFSAGIGSSDRKFDFQFDPSVDELVIPVSQLHAFMQAAIPSVHRTFYKHDKYGRLNLHCSLLSEFRIDMNVMRSDSPLGIQFPSSVFGYSPTETEWCQTGITVSRDINRILIGRILLQVTGSISLDYLTARVGFTPLNSPAVYIAPPVSQPRGPVYADPVMQSMHLHFPLSNDASSTTRWILSSMYPENVDMGDSETTCWTFVARSCGI